MNAIKTGGMLIVPTMQSAWATMLQRRQVWLAPLLDLLFFVVVGFATAPILDRLLLYWQAYFSAIVQQQTGDIGKLILLYAMLFITLYVVYIVFQGLVWAIIANATQKSSLTEYWRRFASASFVWLLLYGIIHLLSLLQDFQTSAAVRVGTDQPLVLPIVLIILTVIMVYGAATEYALLSVIKGNQWHRLKHSIKLFPTLLPLGILLSIIFYAVDAILRWAFQYSQWIPLIGGILVVLPLFLFIRLCWCIAVREAKD